MSTDVISYLDLKAPQSTLWVNMSCITDAARAVDNATDAAKAVDGVADEVIEGAGSKWGNPNTLQDHFDRHGADFGSTSPQDYTNKANNFYNNRNNYQVKVDQNGVIRVYDPKTNTFGSYNADGTTRTFYKPTDGQTYFDRQSGQ